MVINKRLTAMAVMTAVVLTGCETAQKVCTDEEEGLTHTEGEAKVVRTYEASEEDGIPYTYYELEDGTWKCEDTVYQYRLELAGRMPNAESDSHYVVLTDNGGLTIRQSDYGRYENGRVENCRVEMKKRQRRQSSKGETCYGILTRNYSAE